MTNHQLTAHVLRHAPGEGFHETPVPGLRLYRQNHPTTEPMPVVYDPSICIITQGVKVLHLGHRRLAYDPGTYLLNALTLPVEAEIPEASPESPFLGFLIRFDSILVGKLLAEIDEHTLWPEKPPIEAISPCELDEGLLHSLGRLLHYLDDPLDRRILGEPLVREILYLALRGPKGYVLREQALRGGRSQQVARVVHFLERNFRQPLDVESIARQAAMSPSAFHQHFKQLTALSPIQYLKRLRLHEARALLLSGSGAADAGYEVGYNSPSQFSREFRRLFGVTPTQIREASRKSPLLRHSSVSLGPTPSP